MNRVFDEFQIGRIESYQAIDRAFIGLASARQYALAMSEGAYRNLPVGIWHTESETLVAIALKGVIYERK